MKIFRTSAFRAAAAAITACALALACATPPKAESAPAAAAAPKPAEVAPAAAAPDELRAKATELRKKAFELGLKEILPGEYAAADEAFAAGGAQYGSDNAASAASYADAADRFALVVDRGLPLLAAAERKKAEDRRDGAAAKGAGGLFPTQDAYAGTELAKAGASEAAADYEPAVAGYRASARLYEVLGKLCDAHSAREYLASRDLAKWDGSNWSLAEARYKASQELFASDAKASGDAAGEAILRYGIARDTALSYYAADRKAASETERDRASGIKSEVAAKDEYGAAAALYAKAEGFHNGKDYESSSTLYDRAATGFSAAYARAKTKMDAAKNELESLDAAIAAKNADAAR
jgi:hypothetical protein